MSSPGALPADAKAVEDKLNFLFNVAIGVTAAMLVTTSMAVALRTYVRTRIVKTFGWDDITMLMAQVGFIAESVLTFVTIETMIPLVATGTLKMSMNSLVQVIRYTNATYSMTMLLVKISIALFFLKLFSVAYRIQRMLIIFLTVICTLLGIAYLIFTIASCGIMIQSQKTTPMHTGSDWCPVQQTFVNFSIAWSFFNAFTDIVFAILAVQVLWGAKMSRYTKFSASALLVFGCVGGVASCARIAIQFPLGDIRLAGVELVIWSNVEAGVCIIVASLITLRPLCHSVIERAKSTLGSRTKSVTAGSQPVTLASEKSKSRGKSLMTDASIMDTVDLEKSDFVTMTRSVKVEAGRNGSVDSTG